LFIQLFSSEIRTSRKNWLFIWLICGVLDKSICAGKFRLLRPATRNYSLFVVTTTGENEMGILSTLKLSAAQKPGTVTPVQQRRNKLAKRLWEQIELAKAQQAGTQFAPVKFRTYTDKESGVRKQVETSKRIKQWWFTADNGKLALSVRYGTRVLELAKGKFAVEIASTAELVTVLETVKTAALEGELDAAIESAANKLRSGFAK
jgi:hypothetical protein